MAIGLARTSADARYPLPPPLRPATTATSRVMATVAATHHRRRHSTAA
jgi:hypothetical protein